MLYSASGIHYIMPYLIWAALRLMSCSEYGHHIISFSPMPVKAYQKTRLTTTKCAWKFVNRQLQKGKKVLFYILLWVPYWFTSFSNGDGSVKVLFSFESHTNLHHSQTKFRTVRRFFRFESHTNLHHSQTYCSATTRQHTFESHTNLHHSQTTISALNAATAFESHTNLHHSQTVLYSVTVTFSFESHTNLHHSQTTISALNAATAFESHTNLHHSQTLWLPDAAPHCLSPILIYIILKRECK